MESGRGWLAGDWPSTGAFSTLLRRPGLRASSDGVLATKSERKMLACTRSMSGYMIDSKLMNGSLDLLGLTDELGDMAHESTDWSGVSLAGWCVGQCV